LTEGTRKHIIVNNSINSRWGVGRDESLLTSLFDGMVMKKSQWFAVGQKGERLS
jgi:hypothetical protein